MFKIKALIILCFALIPIWLLKYFSFPSRFIADDVKSAKYYKIISPVIAFLCVTCLFIFFDPYISKFINYLFPKDNIGNTVSVMLYTCICGGLGINLSSNKKEKKSSY